MNLRAMRAITTKDIIVVIRSRGVFLPLILVPTILMIAVPLILSATVGFVDGNISDFDPMLEGMPPGVRDNWDGFTEEQIVMSLVLIYIMAPLYLVVPLMVASVIAADSFAGEKERKTLEALVYSPITDRELFWAKLASAWIPAVAIAWGSFILYVIVANLAAWSIMGGPILPTVMWMIMALFVAPGVAGVGLGSSVLISSRVASFQEAYQLGGVVVVPIVFLVVGQATGLLYLDSRAVIIIGVLFWLACGAIIRVAASAFNRTELLARL